jgi:hypothetical protein
MGSERTTPQAAEPVLDIVVDAVAAAEGVSPAEIEPIYDAVDPDAVDALLETPSAAVSFCYCGYRVEIDRDRECTLTPLDDATE